MSVIERYYQNTKGSHNKDYQITVDYASSTVTCTWGPIGGHKTVDVYPCKNAQDADAVVREKHTRRIKHGYSLISSSSVDYAAEVSDMFADDIRDMLEAERISL